MDAFEKAQISSKRVHALNRIWNQVKGMDSAGHGHTAEVLLNLAAGLGTESSNPHGRSLSKAMAREMDCINALPQLGSVRNPSLAGSFPSSLVKATLPSNFAKADLDVGTLTDFSQITGGQALGFVSLDTNMARGTIRPRSFTLYQALRKTPAYQVVDYWPYVESTGGAAPGAAYSSFQNAALNPLQTNAGDYELENIELKLAYDARAVSIALAAQNSFVDIMEQETANAALAILESVDYACFFGNAALYDNQPNGLYAALSTQAPSNIFNAFAEFQGSAYAGLSVPQSIFNLIYSVAASVSDYGRFGRITHAFMGPYTVATLQSLVTTQLNNVINQITELMSRSIVVNGNIRGIQTTFGIIGFEIDIMIPARNRPLQSIVRLSGGTLANGVATPPASVVALTAATTPGSLFTSAYAGAYSYFVAAADSSSNETPVTGSAFTASFVNAPAVAADGSVALTINPGASSTAVAFRVFRAGLGYAFPGGTNVSALNQYRFIGEVAANGTTAVTFNDLNQHIPGSESIFMLDLDEGDNAFDYRFLLNLSRINLFQNSLLMPWAVATIGAPRVRIPKFHGIITNVVPISPEFNPLSSNNPNAPRQ
jgi:hypothetical protein